MGQVRIAVPLAESGNPYGFATRALAPGIMQAADAFSKAVYSQSSLSLREFEGLRMRTAELNGCVICQGFRAARDVQAMFTAAQLEPNSLITDNGPAPDETYYAEVSQWRTSALYSPRERLAIEYAERFAEEPKALAADEDFWTRAQGLFSDAEIVDMSHAVACFMGLGRIAHVLGFDNVCLPFVQE